MGSRCLLSGHSSIHFHKTEAIHTTFKGVFRNQLNNYGEAYFVKIIIG